MSNDFALTTVHKRQYTSWLSVFSPVCATMQLTNKNYSQAITDKHVKSFSVIHCTTSKQWR